MPARHGRFRPLQRGFRPPPWRLLNTSPVALASMTLPREPLLKACPHSRRSTGYDAPSGSGKRWRLNCAPLEKRAGRADSSLERDLLHARQTACGLRPGCPSRSERVDLGPLLMTTFLLSVLTFVFLSGLLVAMMATRPR